MEGTQNKEIKPIQDSNKNNFASNALLLIKWFTTNNKYTAAVKVATMGNLNKQIKGMLENKMKQELQLVTKDAGILCMRPLLVDGMVKDGTVAYFRYIMISTQVCETYKKLNIPLLISKILEKDSRDIVKGPDNKSNRPPDPETIQCLKFIKAWIEVSPKTIPKLLVSSLMAIAQMPVDDKQSKRQCINIEQKILAVQSVRLLSINNFQLWNWSGGISILINAVSDPILAQKSQQIVYTLLYLLNEPKIRNNTHLFQDLNKLFWIFTDIDVNPDRVPQKPKTDDYGFVSNNKSKFAQQLDLCKKAVITILKSWVGLVYLGNQIKTLKSFIQSLRQKIRPQIRFAIYEILQSLLSISNDSYKSKQSRNGNLRVSNLLNCYLITLVQLLIDCDLFKILVQLSGLQQNDIALPAQKFLKQLTILMFNSLPNSSKYIDFLISAATQTGQYSIELKSCSSYVINKIGNYIFDNKIKQDPVVLLNELESMYVSSNLFIPLDKASIAQTTYAINLLQQEQSYKQKYSAESVGLQRQNKHKYQKWKWEKIEQILKNSYDTRRKLETQNNKFLQYLLKFFNPSQTQFINLQWKVDNFKYIRVGQLLFKNLVTLPSYIELLKLPSKSPFQVTISFLQQIKLILIKLFENCFKMTTPLAFIQTMQRQVICWLGLLSYTKEAYNQLLIHYSIFQIIDAYISKKECDIVTSALLFSFDYNRQNIAIKNEKGEEEMFGPRALLQNALFRGSDRLVLQALEIMKILYRTQVLDFQRWGFSLLAKTLLQVSYKSQSIMDNLMDLLIESFEDPVNTSNFIKELNFQKLNQIKDKVSSKFLIKLLSNQTGIENISKHLIGWLDFEFKEWIQNKNIEYNSQMENKLKDALNFVEPKIEGYSIKQSNNFIETIYIYKLPWIGQIQNMYYALLPINKDYGFLLEGDIELQVSEGVLVQFVLMIGAMYVNFNLNYEGEQKPKNCTVEIDLRNKTQFIYDTENTFKVVRDGVTFMFTKPEEQGDILILNKVKIQLRTRRQFDDSQLPIHLFGELSKTTMGVEFLRQKKAHFLFLDMIQVKESAHAVRAALWAIGFMGSCNSGMVLIREAKILETLIKMCFSHNYLSLRGTCRYILNMICGSSQGRKDITQKGWLTNSNSSIGWICVPPDSSKFFTVQPIDSNFWPNNNTVWTAYTNALQPLSQSTFFLTYNKNNLFVTSLQCPIPSPLKPVINKSKTFSKTTMNSVAQPNFSKTLFYQSPSTILNSKPDAVFLLSSTNTSKVQNS